MSEPCDLSAVEARRLIGAGKLSPVELLESCLKRTAETNGAITYLPAEDNDPQGKQRMRSAGKPMPGTEIT